MIAEGMRRAKEMGATLVTVGGGESNPPAEALYASALGKEGASHTAWIKHVDGKR